MAHDATLAAALAILQAAEGDVLPTVDSVMARLRGFGPTTTTVPGAAGDFAFDPGTGGRDVYHPAAQGGLTKPGAVPTQLGIYCARTGRAGPC